MGFFKNNKKEKEEEILRLPDLPKLPELSENIEEEPVQKHSALPELPNSSAGNNFNQRIIKEVITNEQKTKRQFIPQPPTKAPNQIPRINLKEPRTREADDNYRRFSEFNRKPRSIEEKPMLMKKAEPLFIKLDNFEGAIAIFNEAKMRLAEIETALKNIRDIKIREENELNEWEKEIETIKFRLEKIDKELFNKV